MTASRLKANARTIGRILSMHRLHLLRHAKASRDEGVEDRDRKLTRRGRDAARRFGESLPAVLGGLDLVLCSPARRTRETAELALGGLAAPPPETLFDAELYLANSAALIGRLRRIGEATGNVLVVGHNPGLHELALHFADPAEAASPRYKALAGGKFPTLALASFAIQGSWAGIDDSRHTLTNYLTPKSAGD
jgi:phosphohistidine phosphatase